MKMKKIYFLCVIAFMFCAHLSAQTTLALWDFRGADSYVGTSEDWYTTFAAAPIPDVYSAKNDTSKFFTDGKAANRAVRKAAATANGYAMSLGWGPNLIEKTHYFWYIHGINTEGYTDLKFSFKVWSSNTGPREFKVQYRRILETDTTWVSLRTDTANFSFTSAKKSFSFDLPAECNNKARIDLRVLRASSYQLTAPTTVVSGSGQSRIDDALIVGTVDPGTATISHKSDNVKVFNANGKLAITGAAGLNVKVYNLTGSKVLELQNIKAIEETALSSGQIYIVKVNNKAYKVHL
jgi:hypothetical protein